MRGDDDRRPQQRVDALPGVFDPGRRISRVQHPAFDFLAMRGWAELATMGVPKANLENGIVEGQPQQSVEQFFALIG